MLDVETVGDAGPEGEEVVRRSRRAPPPPSYRFVLEPASGIADATWEDPDYLVKGLMPAAGLHVVYGPPGVGKSFLALDVALHVAAGMAWAGKRVHEERACVVYVAAEGARAFKRRIATALREKGIDPRVPFVLVNEAPQLAHGGHEDGFTTFGDEIEAQCKELGLRPRLIVLDTLSRSMIGLDESSSKDMGTFIANARKLSKRFDEALIMPVHHTGKDVDKGMRGSSALHGAADAMWQVRKGDEGLGFLVEKMKDAPSDYFVRFDLRVVECGVDRDGEVVTTQVVEFPADPVRQAPEPTEAGRGTAEAAVARVVERIVGEVGKTVAEGAPAAVGGGKAVETGGLAKAAVARMEAGGTYKDARSAAAVYGAKLKLLLKKGRLVEADGWTWLGRHAPANEGVPF